MESKGRQPITVTGNDPVMIYQIGEMDFVVLVQMGSILFEATLKIWPFMMAGHIC
jgi:hypothetical protein